MADCYEGEQDVVNELMDFAYAGPDNPDQEEANFYFALHEFKEIVERYGIQKVVEELDQETEDELYWYYWNNFTKEDDDDFTPTYRRPYSSATEDDDIPF